MIVSSYSKRSVYPQTGVFGYALDLSLNTTAGSCEFGFSGQNGRQLYFTLNSGALTDYEGNLVHGVYGGQNLSLSGNVSLYQHDYWINGLPVRISGAKVTGAAEWFYVNPQNCQVDLDLYLVGARPHVTFTNIFYSGLTGLGTGFVTNGGERLRIFTGISSDSNYRVEFPTGYIGASSPFSGYTTTVNLANVNTEVSVDYQLITNFGIIDATIINQSQFFLRQVLTPQVNPGIVGSGTSHNFVAWENTVGADPYDQPLSVNFYVRWASGTASGGFTGAWSLQTGLQDTSLLLDVPYYSGITGFSGAFDTTAFGARYFRLNYLTSGSNIVDFWATGYQTGFNVPMTGGLT